jgi:hypothetical protein
MLHKGSKSVLEYNCKTKAIKELEEVFKSWSKTRKNSKQMTAT